MLGGINGNTLVIAGTLIGLAVTFYRFSRVGSETASAQQVLINALEKRIKMLDDALVDATSRGEAVLQSLSMAEHEVSRLEGRPSLERLLDVIETHRVETHERHQMAAAMHTDNTQALSVIEKSLDRQERQLDQIQHATLLLVRRNKSKRKDDP